MSGTEYNGPLLQYARVEVVRKNIDTIQGRDISVENISSLFHSSRAMAVDTMGLNPVASTLFAARFGSVLLTCATFREQAEVTHEDGSKTTVPLNIPSELQKSISVYLSHHFNPIAERKSQPQAFKELREKFVTAGVSSEYLDYISDTAENMAIEVWEDETKLTPEQVAEKASQFPKEPYFMVDQDKYPQFLEETGQWFHKRFEEILDNVLTRKYLPEQEMNH